MKRLSLYLLYGLVLLVRVPAFSQSDQEKQLLDFLAEAELKYGSDVALVNGEKYYYPYGLAGGDPFFHQGSVLATIQIRDRSFPGQRIKYDIYNQQLVLEYTDLSGSKGNLVLPREWVQGFRTEREYFKKMEGPEGEECYYQVLYEGKVSCYYLWSKLYQLDMSSSSQRYVFTDARKEAFLLAGNDFFFYRNNRSFLRAFQDEDRRAVKQFLRDSAYRVKRASTVEMARILEFCNTR